MKSSDLKIQVSKPNKASLEIKKAIEKLYHNEPLRQKLSQGAINKSKDFSWAKKIATLNSIYKSLLN